jgi:uncharacterized protein YegL
MSATDIGKKTVLPFYIIVDASASMEGSKIEALNGALEELHSKVTTDPVLSSIAWIGVITFSDYAEELIELGNLSRFASIPHIEVEARTNYGEVFDFLKNTIDEDVAEIKSQGIQTHRPLVFFLSDGQPTDLDWHDSVRAIHDKSWPYYPNIIAFGIEDADSSILMKISTLDFFMMDASSNVKPSEVISDLIDSVTNTILASTASVQQGMSPIYEISANIPGTIKIAADPL